MGPWMHAAGTLLMLTAVSYGAGALAVPAMERAVTGKGSVYTPVAIAVVGVGVTLVILRARRT